MKSSADMRDTKNIAEVYGENVFSLKTMRDYLSENAYKSLRATITEGRSLDPDIADEVADAMKTWALSKGATHFTHWFQPLTGATAEKHDSFITPDGEGGVMMKFSGGELIKGEPDASSFPSGGLRATFEARGYTAWDPTSPAFIKHGKNFSTLCIPTAFYSYHGEALDKKTPLLRSVNALSKQVCRLARIFGIPTEGKRAVATLGAEQEYFLIDRKYYEKRLDFIQTGRTLFGRKPAKHQQMEDHYFGAIKDRVLNFMEELDHELWKLGIPAKTRHNEVCPAQFEIAPVFEEQNLAIDHNMLCMDALVRIAERHGFVCLLHEKPFAGVNGSGKHNNWSVCGPDGKNWLSPGDNPKENAKFLTMVCTLMKAIDTYAGMLRATTATAGNDHRLGANEAPPAIISMFIGEELTEVLEQFEKGTPGKASKGSGFMEVGVSALPKLPKDVTDRNRTSPFAFTGNKFEFRMVGSNQSCSGSNVVLNTIVSEVLDEICTKLEADIKKGKDYKKSLQEILKGIIRDHKRIIFNGDNYSDEWHKEAKKRGLPNLKNTPAALKEVTKKEIVDIFEKHGVLSRTELVSRHEIYKEQYEKTVTIEAGCALTMAKTMIIPAAVAYVKELADTVAGLTACKSKAKAPKEMLKEISGYTDKLSDLAKKLQKALDGGEPAEMIEAMSDMRSAADALEGLLPENRWPLPTYARMLSMV